MQDFNRWQTILSGTKMIDFGRCVILSGASRSLSREAQSKDRRFACSRDSLLLYDLHFFYSILWGYVSIRPLIRPVSKIAAPQTRNFLPSDTTT